MSGVPNKGSHQSGLWLWSGFSAMRLIVALLLGAFVWLAMWLGLIAGQLGKPHADNLWVREAYDLKRAAAEAFRGERKVLLVGGSATMFGVNSPQLSEALGLPAVNLGVNAGLGTHEIPRQVDDLIEPGDLVVMPLEYRLLLWDGVPSYVTLSWALEHPQTLLHWRWKTLLAGLWSLPLDRVLGGYQGFDPDQLPLGPYGAHKLDALGDQVGTAGALRSAAQLAALMQLPPEQYDVLYRDSTLGLMVWEQWWQRWRARGACLVVAPPPFMFVSAYQTDRYSAFFDGVPHRVEERGVRYLGHPKEGFFPVEAMFDTNYHLTAESRAVYTSWLAGALRSADLGCLPGKAQEDAL